MPDDVRAVRNDSKPQARYAALEERILARDQVGASEAYYDLVRQGRKLLEIVAEAVRIHAPYTHVPYHERIDDGYVNFVNNDHCLLSARMALQYSQLLPGEQGLLAMAQTVWYIPTGLDIWNQKIIKAPGHYARGFKMPEGVPPAPVVHWPDQEPVHLDGPLASRLEHWMTLVHRGQVIEAYRVFLGIMSNPAYRHEAAAQLAFAGLIDVQDRSFQNRSYTTGHKSFRARATIELGEALGWDHAHDILYAGALDIAVGPRWYSTYEMACNATRVYLEGEALHAIPYRGTSPRERELMGNREPLTQMEIEALIEVVLDGREPAHQERITALLNGGKNPRSILDALQLGASQCVLQTADDLNFSLSQHCFEYHNTLGWFWDKFDHPHRLKLLYLAASYLNQAAWNQRLMGEMQPVEIAAPAGADRLSPAALLDNLQAAIIGLDGEASRGWTRAYLDSGADRAPLLRCIALAAARIGNDPHNQELAHCMIEDFCKSGAPDKSRHIIAAAHHTARHRKYGDFLECSHRYGKALGLAELQ